MRALLFTFAMTAAAHAAPQCAIVETDIVSLGEKAARYYAERSISVKIEEEKDTFVRQGFEIGRVIRPALDCKYFPNVVAMDEWRCTGAAQVCPKGASPLPTRPSAGGGAPRPQQPHAANRKPAAPAPKAQ